MYNDDDKPRSKRKVFKEPAQDAENVKKLRELKDWVKSWKEYFSDNEARYLQFKDFIFHTNLTADDISKLKNINKPTIEFNILAAMTYSLLADFEQHEPSVDVTSNQDTANPDDEFNLQQVEVLENFLRHMLYHANNDSMQSKIFLDLLSGYTIVEVGTDYKNAMSFDHDIYFKKTEVTRSGFDILARQSSKADGRYCFQYIPMHREEFELTYGKALTERMAFIKSSEIFNWSYTSTGQQIIVLCYLYEKVSERKTIVKLANGDVMLKEHYAEFLERWQEQGFFAEPPAIVDSRKTVHERIVKYVFCETGIIEIEETDLDCLPLVFIEGFSVEALENTAKLVKQITIPYCYHAYGVQRLKNFAGQTVAAEIENLVQHKFKVAVEGIPTGEKEQAYRDVQHADVLFYHAYYQGNPEFQLPPPMEIQRPEIPAIIESIFMGADQVTQTILGTYDSSALANNTRDISGKAAIETQMFSSKAASVYFQGYVNGMTRVLEVIMSLVPKYFVTKRTIPVRYRNGSRAYATIHPPQSPDGLSLQYNRNNMGVSVELGANSSVQKRMTQEQVIRMMGTCETFAGFINQECLENVVDMMNLPNEESWKDAAKRYMQQLKEQQEQQQQMAMAEAQNNPAAAQMQMQQMMAQVEMAKVEMERQSNELKNQQRIMELSIKEAQVAVEKQKADIEAILAANEIHTAEGMQAFAQEQHDAEMAKHSLQHSFEVAKHVSDTIEKRHVHETTLADKGAEREAKHAIAVYKSQVKKPAAKKKVKK